MDVVTTPRTSSPYVHTVSKTLLHPSAIDDAITHAIAACRFIPQVQPVLARGYPVGLVRGSFRGDTTEFIPLTQRQWCGFTSYADMDREAKAGKNTSVRWYKNTSGFNLSFTWADVWPCAGLPAAGDYSGTAATARQFSNATTGALYISGVVPAGGETRHHAGWGMGHPVNTNQISRHVILYDRVLSYDGCSIINGTTTPTNTLAAQRYIGAGQEGLLVMPTITSAVAAVSANLTAMTFTDQSGTTGVSMNAGYTLPWYTSGPAGSSTSPAPIACPRDVTNSQSWTPFLPLAADVTGVRKIETFVSSGNVTSTISMVLAKPIGHLWAPSAGSMYMDLARSTFTLERVFDNACLSFLISQASSNVGQMMGYTKIVHG